MGTEIERKFLVRGDGFRRGASREDCVQGFLSSVTERVVRVRVLGGRGFLTVKGKSVGARRPEFEYEVPLEDAREMLGLCEPPLIEKTRYRVQGEGCVWEVDEFEGENRGLVLAEVELDSEDQPLSLPDWVGDEVTSDPRYYNSNLFRFPYSRWEKP